MQPRCIKRGLSRLSFLLKTIAEENRLKIICLLKEKERCVCEIVEALKLPHNLISHHLKILGGIGMIEFRKEGKFHFYKLNRKAMDLFVRDFIENIKGTKGGD